MKKIMTSLFVLTLLIPVSPLNAQEVLDNVYVKEHYPARKVIPYAHLREADVMWSKRIWRVVDLREKINLPFYYPHEDINNRRSLINVIMDAVLEGAITAYGNPVFDDEFRYPMTKAEVEKIGGAGIDTIEVEVDEGVYEERVVEKTFDRNSVVQYRIKEDWFFDRQRSVLECRIIGICPVREQYDEYTDEFKGYEPLFWIYFPEVRSVFANAEVYNRFNDGERRTYEDVFFKRLFGSYIYKESNVYNRTIGDYLTGLDALLEAEKIKEGIFNLEHDLWEF